MLDHKRVPNFKIFGMICAAIFFVGSFYFLAYRHGAVGSNNFEMAVLLIFLLGVFGRQLFTRASENIPPLETMAYTVFGLLYVPWLFGFISKIIYLIPACAGRRADGAVLRALPHRRVEVQRHGRVPDRQRHRQAQDGAAHQPEQNVGRIRRRAGVFAAGQLRAARVDAGEARAAEPG